MDLYSIADGTDLDARHDGDAPPLRFGLGRRDTLGGVVIGDGQHLYAQACRPGYQFVRCELAVRGDGMAMQVNAAGDGRQIPLFRTFCLPVASEPDLPLLQGFPLAGGRQFGLARPGAGIGRL